jgi:hypothetical protein
MPVSLFVSLWNEDRERERERERELNKKENLKF